MKGLLACIGGICLFFIIGKILATFFNFFGEIIGGIIVWILIGICYAYRKPIAEKLSPYWYKFIYWSGMLFSNKVAFRYGKLVNAICNMESYYELVKVEQDTVVIRTLDSNKSPVMEWKLYRDMTTKDSFNYENIQVTCQYLTGKYNIPISSFFRYNEDQLLMFNVALQKLNTAIIDDISKK